MWVAKMDMTLAGQKVCKGQLIKPAGSANDHKLFGDNSRWTYRYDGGESLTCGSDGCTAEFVNLGTLERHRNIVHRPERDERERARLRAIGDKAQREENGETIGGLEIVDEKKGPHGTVPYVKHPMT
jgi:hypothetical protein